MDGLAAGVRLPPAHGGIDVERIQFQGIGTAAGDLGGDDGAAAAGERVEDDAAAVGAVAYRVGDQRNRLDGLRLMV